MLRQRNSWTRFFQIMCMSSMLLLSNTCAKEPQRVLHVYGWYGSISHLIKKFEEETGIHVTFDPMDSNEILEAKLLSGSSGYDLVFPTAWPFFARQIPAHLFQPLDKKQLPNYQNLDPDILIKLTSIDPGNTYGVPFTWGLVALGINEQRLQKHLQGPVPKTWGLVFNPHLANKLSGCGISLLDDVQDVYFNAAIYFKELNPTRPEALERIFKRLAAIRHTIKKFDTNLSAEQLASGEICIAQLWVDHIFQALEKFQGTKSSMDIRVILPEEGTTMWIDMMAIPKDAPHPAEAHAFINFLMRPDIAAQVTNIHFTRIANRKAIAYIKPSIQKLSALFPSATYMKKVRLPQAHDLKFQRSLTRAFTYFVSSPN